MSAPRPVVVSLLAGLVATAGACRPHRDHPQRVLRVALASDVLGWIPNGPIPSEAHTLRLNAEVLEGLVRFDRALRIQPALAEGWESPDERTYVFYLRAGLRFSDGRPLSAKDVVASLRAGQHADWGTQDALEPIESVRALDDRRVEIRTRRPYLPLLQTLHLGYVLPRGEIAPGGPRRTIGSGPYALSEWRPGQGFTLERNPNYWGARPDFDRAVFEVVPDPTERVERLERGEVDVLSPVPLTQVAGLRGRSDVQVFSGPGLRVLYLGLRVDRPPFSDPRVREAVALALDRDALVARPLLGMGLPAYQLVPGTVAGYDPTLRPDPVDRARARALLAAAGYAAGLQVRLDGPRRQYANDVQLLDELERQLGTVGIRADVHAMDRAAFFERIDAGKSDMHLIGWACLSGQGSDLLESMLHGRVGQKGAWNGLGLADPSLDAAIDAVGQSRTSREFTEALRSALGQALALHALVPLVVQPEAIALRRGLRWDPSIDFSLWVPDVHAE